MEATKGDAEYELVQFRLLDVSAQHDPIPLQTGAKDEQSQRLEPP